MAKDIGSTQEEKEIRRRKSKHWLARQKQQAQKIANEELVGTMAFFAEVYKDKTQPMKLRMEAARELKSEAVGKPSSREPVKPIGKGIPPLNFDLGSIDSLKNEHKPIEPDGADTDNKPSELDMVEDQRDEEGYGDLLV